MVVGKTSQQRRQNGRRGPALRTNPDFNVTVTKSISVVLSHPDLVLCYLQSNSPDKDVAGTKVIPGKGQSEEGGDRGQPWGLELGKRHDTPVKEPHAQVGLQPSPGSSRPDFGLALQRWFSNVGHDPFGKPVSPKIFTLQFVTVAKL